MKVLLSLLHFLLLLEVSFAQQDSLADVCPLQVGNKWTYGFNNISSFTMGHTSRTDTGIAELQIISSVTSIDSTRWRLRQLRSFTRYTYANYTNYPPVLAKDTSYFEIVEKKSNQHEMYLLTPNWSSEFYLYSVFPLWKYYSYSYLDSSRFFRYVPLGPTDVFSFGKYIGAFITTQRNVVFCRDTGIVQSTGWASDVNSQGWNWRYSLLSFIRSYSGPHLNHPRSLSFAALTGFPSDTAIILNNDGSDTVHIYSITSSDQALVTALSASPIPPVNHAVLSLRHNSPSDGESFVRIIIASSAISSPDTIEVTIHARIEPLLRLSQRWYNYDKVFFSQRPFIAPLVIANAGNTPLSIDSLRSSSEYVTWKLNQTSLRPGDSTICRIEYVPNPTQFNYPYPYPYGSSLTRHQDTLFIYSNAKSKVDTVCLSADVLGGTVRFSSHSLSFNAEVNGTGKAVLIIAVGYNPILVKRGQPSNASFQVAASLDLELSGYGSYSDTISFVPQQGGEHRSFILYSTHATTSGDPSTAIDTIWLSGVAIQTKSFPTQYSLNQNYPNPFNPGTTIRFDIPTAGYVTLKVFDLLGREVATIVSEDMKPDSYEKPFDGSRLSTGMYLYRLQCGSFVQTKKLLLLR